MVACNIFRCANILLTILFILLVFNVPTSSAQGTGNLTKPQTVIERVKAMELVTSFRFNKIFLGGLFNMILSSINLIIALVNFYLIFGKFTGRIRQVHGKLEMGIAELTHRDLHPKVKMGLSREILPNTPMLTEVMGMMKGASPMFDNTNDLFQGQTESRLRKFNCSDQGNSGKKDKSMASGKPSEESKSSAASVQSSAQSSAAPSVVSTMKKED